MKKIIEGVSIIREALECYISGSGVCREFKELTAEVDAIEEHADKIKRNIRNHLPRRLFMPVDKTLFFELHQGAGQYIGLCAGSIALAGYA